MQNYRILNSVKFHIVVVVGGCLSACAALFFSILYLSMPDILLRAEDQYLTKQRHVVTSLLEDARQNMLRISGEIGIWNEAVAFIEGKNPHFIKNSWPEISCSQIHHFNFMVMKNRQGQDVYAEFYDYAAGNNMPFPPGFTDRLAPFARETVQIFSRPRSAGQPLEKAAKQGILVFDGTPYGLAAMPIMPSRESTSPVGAILVGTILSNAYLQELTHHNEVRFDLIPAADQAESAIRQKDAEIVHTDVALQDIDGHPLLLRMSEARTIYVEGKRTLDATTTLLMFSMAVAAIIFYQLVRRLVVDPMTRISQDIENIATTGIVDEEKFAQTTESAALYSSLNKILAEAKQPRISIDALERILDGINAFLYVTDPTTSQIMFMNKSMMQHFGFDEHVMGQRCWEVLQTGMTGPCPFCKIEQLLADPAQVIVWEAYNSMTGHYYQCSDCLIEWSHKQLAHLQHAVDITATKMLEKELIAAKEQAEHSSKAKGEFLSRMSHEMRTPLNAVIGMTKIARTSHEMEKKDYCLEKIDGASTHLLGVINDILDMSKIEANKFELSPTEFNFEKMLMRTVNVVNFRVDEKHQNLIVNVATDMPQFLIADEQRLAQIIANLLSNAVKFTPEYGTITLTAHRLAEDFGVCTLQIAVRDTGIGITREQQSKLFHSFEQADGGIARKFGGTGLGLAISKSIVQLMGGDIWVESTPGEGATFAFTMKAPRGASKHQSLFTPDVNWQTLRVLFVDDAPEVREYLRHFASSVSLDCEIAADGFEAYEMLKNAERGFNILFADWQMPGMDGIELIRRVKGEDRRDIVAIIISATQWNDIEEAAKLAGVDGFISKPLFASSLLDCISNCLGGGQPADTEPVHAPDTDDGCFAGYRILLAEDVEINREIVMTLLEHTEIVIDPAQNGREAVEMFTRDPCAYALIFMDLHMPEVDGYEATRRIRALDSPEARAVPIIAMTANVFREDIEKCLAVGMNDHVGKPLNLDEVMERLKRHLPARTR